MNGTTSCFTAVICAGIVVLSLSDAFAEAGGPVLQLEVKIPLGNVAGRIDHMAVDLARHRLFVAELGNDTVGIVDLNAQKVIYRIAGLKEPQGVAYVQMNDSLYIANGGDGRCGCLAALVIRREHELIWAQTRTTFASRKRPASFLSATAKAPLGSLTCGATARSKHLL